MKYNKDLCLWYCKQISIIHIKLINKKQLTSKQKLIYYILDEYDFYAPKKYHNHNNLT